MHKHIVILLGLTLVWQTTIISALELVSDLNMNKLLLMTSFRGKISINWKAVFVQGNLLLASKDIMLYNRSVTDNRVCCFLARRCLLAVHGQRHGFALWLCNAFTGSPFVLHDTIRKLGAHDALPTAGLRKK